MDSTRSDSIGRSHRRLCLWLVVGGLCFGCTVARGQVAADSVLLDSVLVLNEFGDSKAVLPTATLALQARENYLTFRFRAHRNVPLRYRLSGLDNDWRAGFSTDRVHYANLPGGAYTFRWRVGESGPEGSQQVVIDAPFWRRWWFVPVLLLYLMSIAGIVLYLFLRYRFRQKLRDLQARDRIARDLHDDMGSYLSSISILSASARRNALRHPEKTQVALDTIGQTARQMLETMGDIVWSINPAHDAMSHVVDRMRDVGNALFAPTDVEFSFQADDSVGTFPLHAEARHDFFLLYKEALTNAARYAQASRVRVALRGEHNQLLLTIQDNGCGFDPAHPERRNAGGGNGLGNLHKRAQQLNATLTIDSTPGEGTTVTLKVGSGQ